MESILWKFCCKVEDKGAQLIAFREILQDALGALNAPFVIQGEQEPPDDGRTLGYAPPQRNPNWKLTTTPLSWALVLGRMNSRCQEESDLCVAELIRMGADVNVAPFIYAVENPNPYRLDSILVGFHGHSVLHVAFEMGRLNLIRDVLIPKKTNARFNENDPAPLVFALMKGCQIQETMLVLRCFQSLLLERGRIKREDVTSVHPENGNNAMHILATSPPSIEAEMEPALRSLMDMGVDPTLRNNEGKTPDMLAVEAAQNRPRASEVFLAMATFIRHAQVMWEERQRSLALSMASHPRLGHSSSMREAMGHFDVQEMISRYARRRGPP